MTDIVKPIDATVEQEIWNSVDSPALEAIPGDTYVFPLSPMQERMWCADRAQPGYPAYNASFRWILEGPVDPIIIERVFNEILRRHEILRATFTAIDGQPVQLIPPPTPIHLRITDLRHLPEAERDTEFDRICAEEAKQSFDLVQGPLLRIGLLHLQDQQYVLTLTLHHIVCDGWSISLIMEELQKLYSAFREGRESPLSDLQIQYGDYVMWQKERLQSEEIKQQLEFWKKKLLGYKRLEVPGDLPKPQTRTINSAILSDLLPRNLTDALREFSNQQGGTMFITTLAVCMMLLRRVTGQSDIAVGSTIAGRNRTDLENLVGLFVNQLVFRNQREGSLTFSEFAASVKETVWEAFANQDIPQENILKVLRPGQDPYSEPLYLINFICQREYARAATFVFEFAGIRMSTLPSKSQGALFDLCFFMVERAAGWRLSLEYNTNIYSAARSQQLLDNFRELLEAVAENPDRKLGEFTLTGEVAIPGPKMYTEAENQKEAVQASMQPNSPEVYAMPASPVQQRFWRLAQLDPENAAFHMPACVRIAGPLSTQALESSYRYLIERHETLRTRFEEIDAELSQVISPNAVFSLAITDLQATPGEDRETKLQELIRSEAALPFDLAAGPLFRARLFRLEPEESVLVTTVHHILCDGWSHRVMQNDLWTAYDALAAEQVPSLPLLSIQYSDFTTWQKEWLASDDAREQLEFWTRTLSGELPVLDFPTDRPPSKSRASQGALETHLLPEELTQALKGFSQSQNATMFVLMLAAFGVLLSKYSHQDDVLIGSPVANRRAETEPLIGPFSGPIALRLNLSGDPTLLELLKQAQNVTFEALGRTELPFDILVENLKVRASHGRNPLFQFYFFYQAAFLQPRRLEKLTVTPMPSFSVGTSFELQLGIVERQEGLRAQLEYNPDLYDAATIQGILQDYETLLHLFLTEPTKQLKEMGPLAHSQRRSYVGTTAESRHAYVAPRNRTERELVRIWERIFEQSQIGVQDDFFDLGGQSLLAGKLMAAIEKKFHRKIDLSHLAAAPTIEALASFIGEEEGQASLIVPVKSTGNKVPLFCMHCGTGHVFRYREMAALLDEDQPVYGVRAPDFEKATRLPTVEELAALYIADIRRIQEHGPYQVCGLSFGGMVAYEVATQLALMGEEVSLMALFDTGNPAYYRDLPFMKSVRFRSTYLVDRFKKYGRRITKGEFKEMYEDLKDLVAWRAEMLRFKLTHHNGLDQMREDTLKPVRDKVIMFASIGQEYTPKVYPGKVHLFRAGGRTKEFGRDLALGWAGLVKGGVDVHNVPGGHVGILEKPFVQTLVDQLKRFLVGTRNGA